jgi:hypothetical protein
MGYLLSDEGSTEALGIVGAGVALVATHLVLSGEDIGSMTGGTGKVAGVVGGGCPEGRALLGEARILVVVEVEIIVIHWGISLVLGVGDEGDVAVPALAAGAALATLGVGWAGSDAGIGGDCGGGVTGTVDGGIEVVG